MTDMPGAVGSGRAPDPIGRPRSGYLLTCPRTGARPGSRWRPAARRPIGKFCAYQGWLHRVPVATPNTSSTIVGEGSLTGLFTGLSSGDPQRPSRRLAVSCRWSWSWPCAELTVDRVSCRRTAGPGLAGGREPPGRGRP